MVARSNDEVQPPWLVLIVAVTAGAVAVLASLLAFDLLTGDTATRAAELDRIQSYMYWSQPFIYVMAGMIAGARDSRWGPVRAPVVGLVLASICWVGLRKQNMLPGESNVVVWLMTSGALFALGGALVAPLIRDHIGKAVGGIVLLGFVAFAWTFLNLGSVSGVVQREVITRVAGETRSMETVRVSDADVALLDPDSGTILYAAKTNRGGRYHISGVPIGEYALRVWDPATSAIITQQVEVERSITGGTPWQTVALPTLTEESGPLFE
ncbi:MAG: carboxypeptidase-like regulatory domain-containing protein [Armatimonadota bacterium]